jgi:O-antigen/teichoic acid export membrane protein
MTAGPSTAPAPAATRTALRGAGPLALAGLAANVANVGVTLAIARLLTTREYGALAQLIALFFVLSIPGSALLVGVVRRVTGWRRAGLGHRVAPWAARVHRRGLLVIVGFAAVTYALRPLLADTLGLPDAAGLPEVLVSGAAWGLLCVDRGLLQAGHRYGALARNLAVEGLSRSLLTVTLVAAGRGVWGATLALLVSVTLADLHARRALRPELGRPDPPADAAAGPTPFADPPADAPYPAGPDQQTRRRLAADVAVALGALALLGVLQNLDVVLLGALEPANAGAYAAISVACKPLVLAALVLAGFLLPEAASRRHAGGHALHQLGVVVAILAVPAGALLLATLLAPRRLLAIAFGDRLTAAAPAFAELAAAMTCLGLTVLFAHYLLAVGRRLVLVPLGGGTAATVLLVAMAGGDPVATARANLAGQAALAVICGASVLAVSRAGAARR